jgi:hypothetical protein
MIASLALCLAIAPLSVAKVDDSYEDIKDSFKNLSTNVAFLQKEAPTVGFRAGTCFLGGYVTQNKSIGYNIKADSTTTLLIVTAATGNDYEAPVTAKVGNGANLAQSLENSIYAVEVTEGTTYNIRIGNKGENAFVSAAILKDEGGRKYPLTGLKTAVARMAEVIQSGMADGYGITPYALLVVGNVLGPSESITRGSLNETRWMAGSTSDGPAGAMKLVVTSSTKAVLAEDNNEERDCISVFNKAVAGGSVKVTNPRNENNIVLLALMS